MRRSRIFTNILSHIEESSHESFISSQVRWSWNRDIKISLSEWTRFTSKTPDSLNFPQLESGDLNQSFSRVCGIVRKHYHKNFNNCGYPVCLFNVKKICNKNIKIWRFHLNKSSCMFNMCQLNHDINYKKNIETYTSLSVYLTFRQFMLKISEISDNN